MRKGEMIGPALDSGWNRDFQCSLVPSGPLADDRPIPFFMLEGNRLAMDVPAGTTIVRQMVEEPENSALWALRAEQDDAFADMLYPEFAI